MNCEEARELITALIDNEVSDLERSLIGTHLQECPRCLHSCEQERALKQAIHRLAATVSAPPELKEKILLDNAAPAIERKPLTDWFKPALTFRPVQRPALALALILIISLPLFYFLQQRREAISLAALRIQEKIAAGNISLQRPADPHQLRDWQTRAVEGRFAPMEYDFPSFQVVGGAVEEIDGRKVLVTVYAGKENSITCLTFLGTEQDVPENAAMSFDDARHTNYYVFGGNGYNAVLHREGNVICVLTSKMPLNHLLAVLSKAEHA